MRKKQIILCGLLLIYMAARAQHPVGNTLALIPYPQNIEIRNGQFEISSQTQLVLNDQGLFWKEAAYLQSLISPVLGQDLSSDAGSNSMVLAYSDRIEGEEGYELDITPSCLTLKAGTPQGIFYGIQTIRQLLPHTIESGRKTDAPLYLPALYISDKPAFEWRGSMIDVARHFFSVEYLKKHIDRLALYKMNKLHLHLTDDEGWRIEIKKYPKLTSQSAWRTYNHHDTICMNLAKENPDMAIDPRYIIKKEGQDLYGGFFTQEQIRELIGYAASRHIEIIPEIDMPGHMLAAISAYPYLTDAEQRGWGKVFSIPICPGKEESYTFVQDVLTEIIDLFPSNYIHIGADEVEKTTWATSESCKELMEREGIKDLNALQSYFVHKVQEFVESKGKEIIAWDEILDGGTNARTNIMYWRGWESDSPRKAVWNGNSVIMSPTNPLYFDYTPDKSSLYNVYHLNVIYDNVPKEKEYLIKGAQANLWAEKIASEKRSEFLLFPRITALAERLWTNQNLFESYSNRLPEHFQRLDELKVNYRLPDLTGFAMESVFIKEATFQVENPLPETSIYYTTDGTPPDRNSKKLEGPMKITKPVQIKFASFSPNGGRGDVYTVNYRQVAMRKATTINQETVQGLHCAFYHSKVESTGDIKGVPDKEQIVRNITVPQEFITPAFALKYNGYIQIPETGIYTFYFTCDDGGVLRIHDEVIVDNDGLHSAIEKSGQAALAKGLHPFRIDFVEGGGGFTLKLQYSFNGSKPQDTPDSWFVTTRHSDISYATAQEVKYRNPTLSIEERTQDLLNRMTLEEKIGQLLCPLGWEMYEKNGSEVTYSRKFEQLIKDRHVGMFWAVYRADPWTQKTLETGLTPELAAKAGNALQKYVVENTRLGIPLFLAEECPHGHMAIGTTVFPVGIGMASTWNPALIEQAASAISKEVRVQGGHIGYGPVLDLARDPRWSRVEEGFGEDPVLSARMGAAITKGHGGGDISNPHHVISTLKHFIAYGIPEGGHNGNTALVGERELHENFLPPFKAAIDAGALSVMTAYNSVDGIPCTANRALLTDLLRQRWNFNGFVVSDLVSIDGLQGSHRIVDNMQDAGIAALSAGVDVDLGANSFPELAAAVKAGKMPEAMIDSAVCRVLRLKFGMGLFENPYVEPQWAKQTVRNHQHVAVALQTACQSVVLLKNEKKCLPLSKNLKRIAVIGPNADNPYNQLGDYTAPQERQAIHTVLDGVKAKMPDAQIEYVKGCAIRDTATTDMARAVKAAKKAEVAIVVVGGSSARDFETKYIETGAAIASETISDIECGEGFDRATLDLLGKQLELLQAIKATGTPVIVIYIQGRPLNMNWASEHADALLTAWYPGQEGGTAIADVLWGDYNPAGRLPISVPRAAGQIPVYYNKKNPRGHDYGDMPSKPLYSFGYGLSYTQFEYNDLGITQKSANQFEVSFTLKNTGDYDGEEVAQLYLRDEYASVVQPVMQLKHFGRIFLKKGEERRITFVVDEEDLSIINKDMEKTVEPGKFIVMIGSSSDQIKLKGEIIVDYTQGIVTDEFVYDTAPFPSVHSATIEETPGGLVTAFFGGEYEGHPEVGIYVSRQVGAGWTVPVKVAEGIISRKERKACYNPVLYQVPGKELILFYKIGKNVQDWSGFLTRSYDNGITWSKPEALPKGFLGPVKNRPLLIGDRLICGSSTEDNGWRVHVEFTPDGGKTWTKTAPVNDTEWSIIQPSLLTHKDGRLQMVCRSRNEAVISSCSSDNGHTWSTPIALQVPNNNSGIDAITLQDGRFLMVYNHVKATESAYRTKKRTPLNVAVSNDGIHWDMSLILEDSPVKEYSYPSVIQGKDGMIHVVYTWRREKIKYVKIDPALLADHKNKRI